MKIFLLALAVSLSACAHHLSVRHLTAPGRLSPETAGRVARLYLFLQAPPADDPEKGALGKALDVLGALAPSRSDERYQRSLTRLEMEDLARHLAAALSGPASQVVGYQVSYASSPPAWLADFSPTGSLWLSPSDIQVSQEEFEAETKRQGEKGRKKYKSGVDFSIGWRLYAEPEHTILAEGRLRQGNKFEEESGRKAEDLSVFLKPKVPSLLESCVEPLRRELLPHEVSLARFIRRGEDGLRAAEKQARLANWEEAARIWSESAQSSGNWEAHHNLGVYHERASRWEEARRHYRLAWERAPEGSRRMVQAILDELGQLMVAPVEPAAPVSPAFYGAPLAVLPFANESVDLSAHDYLRLKVFESLARRGYSLLPLTELDGSLRERGIQEGGQLNLLPPAAMAKHLGAERLLYGTVEEFRVVNLGVFYRRQVRLSLRLMDKEGRTLWRNTAQTVVQSGARPREAASSFLVNLASTAAERLAKTYLKEEADETVRRSLETLPRPLSKSE